MAEMLEVPTNVPLDSAMTRSSSSRPLPHISKIVPGRRSPDPEKPVHGIKDFPKLQAPYLVALSSDENTSDVIHIGRCVL